MDKARLLRRGLGATTLLAGLGLLAVAGVCTAVMIPFSQTGMLPDFAAMAAHVPLIGTQLANLSLPSTLPIVGAVSWASLMTVAAAKAGWITAAVSGFLGLTATGGGTALTLIRR